MPLVVMDAANMLRLFARYCFLEATTDRLTDWLRDVLLRPLLVCLPCSCLGWV